MIKLIIAMGLFIVTTLANADTIILGMGCFWGAEKRMAELPGVLDVESGYANGDMPGTYEAVMAHERKLKAGKASGRNHAEVVKVTFDPQVVSLEQVLARFWESHDPTQGDRQGNDVGSNYRSAVYTANATQQAVAQKTRDTYQMALKAAGRGTITTEVAPLKAYFKAEEYHQDYLKKNPSGYCGLGGTGVKYPGSVAAAKAPEPVKMLDPKALDAKRQLIVFEAEDCAFCKQFKAEVLDGWKSEVRIARTMSVEPPAGWKLEKALFATPTIVLFENGKEVSRFTGWQGDQPRFWKWLGFQLLTPCAAEDRLRARHRAARHRFPPRREAPRHLRRSDHRCGAVPQRHQVQQRYRLAKLLQPPARRAHRAYGQRPRHAPRRGQERELPAFTSAMSSMTARRPPENATASTATC